VSERTEPPAGPDIRRLADRLERMLLGGDRQYTPQQVSDLAGVDREFSHQLWRSLGFPSVGDDDVTFTDYDVAALDVVKRIRDLGLDDDELRAAMARFVGQTFARLASWQGQLVLSLIAGRPELVASEQNVVGLIEQLLPDLEQLQRYVWRRQLAAYLDRVASQADGASAEQDASMAVGFADLAGFTSLTRRVEEDELRRILDAFEQLSTEVVGSHRGRVVKTIGDEVLFTAGGAAAGAEIALDLLDAAERDERLPPLRVGIACGPVIDRLGDVYGATVNIAARLTSLGRPGQVLVDRNMATALEHDERFRLKARRPESVRGYGHLRQWRLRRAEAG
jgi:adenylate cyclase